MKQASWCLLDLNVLEASFIYIVCYKKSISKNVSVSEKKKKCYIVFKGDSINTGRVSILFKFYSVNEQIPFSA